MRIWLTKDNSEEIRNGLALVNDHLSEDCFVSADLVVYFASYGEFILFERGMNDGDCVRAKLVQCPAGPIAKYATNSFWPEVTLLRDRIGFWYLIDVKLVENRPNNLKRMQITLGKGAAESGHGPFNNSPVQMSPLHLYPYD